MVLDRRSQPLQRETVTQDYKILKKVISYIRLFHSLVFDLRLKLDKKFKTESYTAEIDEEKLGKSFLSDFSPV